MAQTKGLVASKTVQGAVIAGLPAIDHLLTVLGVFQAPLLSEAAAAVASAAGALLAIYGRIKASKKLFGLF